jgi:hypothetical protein
MESALALLHRSLELGFQNIDGAVIRHLQVMRARVDGRKIVVGAVRRLAGLADNGEQRREGFEACD